ncbi:MAG: hypothetical protein ACKORF_03750 [Micrococcales bacterium]
MKKSVLLTTAAATVGLATVLTMGAIAPASAKGNYFGNDGSGVVRLDDHSSSVATASLPFTFTNVPANYTNVQDIASQLVFKVVPLPADATSAPATPPAATFKSEGKSDKNKGKSDKSNGKSDMGKGQQQFKGYSSLSLSGGILSGSIDLRSGKTAGVQNFGIYPMFAADVRTGLAAQAGDPVFVTATTAADGTVTLTQSGPVTLDLGANTGTLKAPQTAVVNIPADGKTYQLEITHLETGDDQFAKPHVVAVVPLTGTGAVTINLPLLRPGSYTYNLITVVATGGFTFDNTGSLTAPVTVG